MRWFAATLFAALIAATVPGAAWAETDVVLENESSGTDVHTGDSSFTNNESQNVGSGTQFGERARPAANSSAGTQTTGAAVQGQAETLAPATQSTTPATTTSTTSVPRSSADLVLADANQQVSDSIDALFVGLPITNGSVSS